MYSPTIVYIFFTYYLVQFGNFNFMYKMCTWRLVQCMWGLERFLKQNNYASIYQMCVCLFMISVGFELTTYILPSHIAQSGSISRCAMLHYDLLTVVFSHTMVHCMTFKMLGFIIIILPPLFEQQSSFGHEKTNKPISTKLSQDLGSCLNVAIFPLNHLSRIWRLFNMRIPMVIPVFT